MPPKSCSKDIFRFYGYDVMDIMFNFDIPLLSYIFIGLQILLVLFLFLYLLRPLKKTGRLSKPVIPGLAISETLVEPVASMNNPDISDSADISDISDSSDISDASDISGISDFSNPSDISDSSDKTVPKVSVVVYSTVNEEVLTEFLKSVCSQDYPDFEVIVVCDASFETSGILSEKYSELFKNVYVTFIPPGSHNLSRRKLALTLGIKAASGEIIVTTVANALIPSDKWLSILTTPFFGHPEREISLGYSHPDYSEISGPDRSYKEFFSLLTDSRWIGYALMDKTYRGDGFNMAFRRELFFRCKGYSKTMHLHTGEDDLFVHENADATNTAVAIAPEAILTTIWGPTASRVISLRRSQYDFTARWLPLAPFVRAGASSLSQWLIPGLGALAAVLSLPNLIPAIAAAIIWIAFMIAEASLYRKAADKLGATPLSWQVPLFWLVKPLNNFVFRSAHRSSRFKNFTWQRHKLSK